LSTVLTLAVDLSCPTGTLCLLRDGAVLREMELTDTQRHSELFLGALDSLLASQQLSLAQVDQYLTSSGPGSFTGLRIAWASLKAFALSNGKPLCVVSGDEARARAWMQDHPGHRGPLSTLTPLGKKTWVRSDFEISEANELKARDSQVTEDSSIGELLTLRASQLALCPRPEILRTAAEIAAAGPTYLGSRW